MDITTDYSKQYLGKEVDVVIDRPIDSKHPEYKFKYALNYGYLPNTKAPDGEEIDAYIIDLSQPVEKCTGKCFAIIRRVDDEDDKLVVATKDKKYTDQEIITLTNFQEQFFKIKIIR